FVAGFIGTPQMNFFKESTLTSEDGKIYVNFVGNNKILLPKAVAARIKNVNEYLDTGKPVTLGVRPEDIHQDQMFISSSPETTLKARIDVIEKLGAETQIYCELDYEGKENSVIDNSTQMIAKISSRAIVALNDVVVLAFDANHIHLFDGETEASILERDEGYEVIEENAEGSAFVPPTPQEMRDRIAAARSVTKEMKAQMRKDERMAKLAEKRAAKAAAAEAAAKAAEEEAAPVEEAPVEAPVEEATEETSDEQ
nr:TOBE domain-containing protein [Clostridia bacterium]